MTNKRKNAKKRNSCYVVERAFGSSGLPSFGDADGDGVPNFFDCKPRNPNEDGIFRDVGRAVATRVKHEVGDIKEAVLEEIAGEEKREERLEIQEIEKEAYLKERKKVAEEEARRRARAKFERAKEVEELRKERRKETIREEAEALRTVHRVRHRVRTPRVRTPKNEKDRIPYTSRRIYT